VETAVVAVLENNVIMVDFSKEYEFAWHSGLFLITCLLLYFVSRLVFLLFNRQINVNAELVDKDNPAFYAVYVSYFIGFVMIIGGVMNSGGTQSIKWELIYTLLYGGIGILLLNSAAWLNDRFIYKASRLWHSIEKGDVAAGIIKGASFISTGIIISGVLLLELERPLNALIFIAAALIFNLIGLFYYNLITPFNVREQVYKGNTAVAVATGGAQIAFAILIFSGFQLTHESWQETLIIVAIDVIGGFIILPAIRFIVDKVFIPGRSFTDELINQEKPNIGLGVFEASAYISGALLLIWCWNL
jgi:uncharacterized membrane protein YjfL (UPF0719 family)